MAAARNAAAAPAGRRAPAALDAIVDQPRVRDFLGAAVAEGHLAHAYLFVGAPGSGKHEAAEALAKCVVCPEGGCGACDECGRVARRSHPDVHWLEPGSAQGYLVAQVREVVADVALAPVRAQAKAYVLERAELLRGSAANALLKTLEEPPRGTYFVLCARNVEALLPTIVSRCQVVPFAAVARPEGVAAVTRAVACSEEEARVALAVSGSPSRAVEYLRSPARCEARATVVRAVDGLARDDGWDVIVAAREVVAAAKVPVGDLQAAQEEALDQTSDYLGATALKQVADANKRALTARERSAMMEVLAAAESLLRDALAVCEGVAEPIVNADAAPTVRRLADEGGTGGVLAALGAVGAAADDLDHNVTPQLTVEVMLFRIKEALACRPSSR